VSFGRLHSDYLYHDATVLNLGKNTTESVFKHSEHYKSDRDCRPIRLYSNNITKTTQ